MTSSLPSTPKPADEPSQTPLALEPLPELPPAAVMDSPADTPDSPQSPSDPASGSTSRKSGVSKKRALIFIILLAVLGGGFWFIRKGGGGHDEAGTPGGGGRGGGKGRPVQVTTAKVAQGDLPLTFDAIGNVEALESVSIQPQITGLLKRVHFTQGQIVSKGQLLFEIDARLQNANLAQMNATLSRSQAGTREAKASLAQAQTQIAVAEANLKRDRAQLEFARQEVARTRQLLEKKLIALDEHQRAQASLSAAEAAVAADQAALTNARTQIQAEQARLQTTFSNVQADRSSVETAKIQLGFTRIYSPITGKTGPLLINAGNNVQANSSELVNIKRLSPILVSFAIPETRLAAFQQAMLSTGVSVSTKGEHPESGRLVFIDNTVNKSNGTVILKASFDNPSGRLWPGQFVDVTAQIGVQGKALHVPAEAVQKGPEGDFVYVVKDDKARVTPVIVDRVSKGVAVISKGLSPGLAVVVSGQLALAPDAPVKIAGKDGGKGGGKGTGKAETKDPDAKPEGERGAMPGLGRGSEAQQTQPAAEGKSAAPVNRL